MTDRSKQIIPDSQAVALCLNGTFLISDLLAAFKTPQEKQKTFIDDLNKLHLELKQGGYSREHYLNKIGAFIGENITSETLKKAIEGDIDCSLLEPSGKGWQKGKLKLCFEFTPEENESMVLEEKPVKNQSSPLDEIRQLANELTAMTSIEQN
jgi:KGK domain